MQTVARIGAVRFLNARPLMEGLESGEHPCRVTYDVPSALAVGLSKGEYDVALIPVAAYLAGVGGDIVPGVSISCRGPVGTIKLFSRRPLGEIRTLALDRGSRSSALLARAALSALHGSRPSCIEAEPDLPRMLAEADAAVVIGQAALLSEQPPAEASVIVDLGELWWEWQRVPLVLAVWAFREAWASEPLAEALCRARDRGIASLDRIAEREGAERGVEPGIIRRYFREMLDFDLTPAHIEGITRYRDLLLEEGLLENRRELSFA